MKTNIKIEFKFNETIDIHSNNVDTQEHDDTLDVEQPDFSGSSDEFGYANDR